MSNWRNIDGYPGYKVSDDGRVWSSKRNKILIPLDNNTGYDHVRLYNQDGWKQYKVHRLVAEAFLEHSDDCTDVNHIDGNKRNNTVNNLEWCTRSENNKHAYETGLREPGKPYTSKCIRIVETGEMFESIHDCAKSIDGNFRHISDCLKGRRNTHRGFHFEEIILKPERRSALHLYDHQLDALNRMHNGCILVGGVGSGKSITSISYFYLENGGSISSLTGGEHIRMKNPKDLYIITTARKRDTCEWQGELAPFRMSPDPESNMYSNKVVIDSWNNIAKYADVKDAMFIFDEQRVCGYGKWSKTFIKIAKENDWILLSATPADCWSDFIPVFIANGFYKNKTEFEREHIVWSYKVKFPKVDRYINTGRLIRLRNKILVDMPFERPTTSHHEDVFCDYDIPTYKNVMKLRWNPYKDAPIETANELCLTLRKIVNTSEDRQVKLLEIAEKHPRMIIFYNFNYELDILRNLYYGDDVVVAEWNGWKHDEIPKTDKWIYLVQYTSGCEGWNCIKTDTIIFFSENYSYKVMTQASGRIDRLNTPYNDLYYYHFKTRSGIDLAISRALKNKKDFNEMRFVGGIK